MEQSPVIPVKFHVRMLSLLTVLAATDISLAYSAYEEALAVGVTVIIMFGFEVRVTTGLRCDRVATPVALLRPGMLTDARCARACVSARFWGVFSPRGCRGSNRL